MTTAQDPTVFIGSSGEGLDVAEELQVVLDPHCAVDVWNQGAFGLGEVTINALLRAVRRYDFAVFVLSADDLVIKRGKSQTAARDNILFEAGLFIGAIGLERTFLLTCHEDKLKLPSDLDGVTHAKYRRRDNLRSALAPPGRAIRKRIDELGLLRSGSSAIATVAPVAVRVAPKLEEEWDLLEGELDTISTSAEAQGWKVKTRSKSAFRLVASDGRRFSLSIGDPRSTREGLRNYARELNEYGLRLSRTLTTPVGEAPPQPDERSFD